MVSGVVELEELVLPVAATEVEPVVSGVVDAVLGVVVLAAEVSGVVAGGVEELLAYVEPVPGAVEAVEDVAPVVSGEVLVEAVVPLSEVLLVLGAPGSAWLGNCVEVLLELASGVEVGVVLLALSEPAALVEPAAEAE